MTEKCRQSGARLKVQVPEQYSIDAYKEQVLEVLLYPNSTIIKEKDGTYSIIDSAGDKIKNVDVETIVECKDQDAVLNLNYVRLEGLPSKLNFNEIILYKPLTNESKTITIQTPNA